MDVQVRCPHCQAVKTVPAALIGRAAVCDTCNRRFVLPAEMSAQPLYLDGSVPTAMPADESAGDASSLMTGSGLLTVPDLGLELVPVLPRPFRMGCDTGYLTEPPVHTVPMTQKYWMSRFLITQIQYQTLMHTNPSYFSGDFMPVETVSWFEAIEFCRRLTESQRLARRETAALVYRLPTEAEWEFCCKTSPGTEATAGEAGTAPGDGRAFCFGDDPALLGEYAWYETNSEESTHPVGEKRPNEWGLFDMHGNVSEWCLDWFASYPAETLPNPMGPATGDRRVRRGGSWASLARRCRATDRAAVFPDCRCALIGFRVVAVAEGVAPYAMDAKVW